MKWEISVVAVKAKRGERWLVLVEGAAWARDSFGDVAVQASTQVASWAEVGLIAHPAAHGRGDGSGGWTHPLDGRKEEQAV